MIEATADVKTLNKISKSVFLVEDDLILASLIKRKLAREGYEVTHVARGEDAINQIIEESPTFVLLDYRLPDMTAKDIVSAIHENKIFVPFIIMTAHSEDSMVIDMMKMGARDYLIKDANFVDLLPAVVNQVYHQIDSEDKLSRTLLKLRESERRYRLLFERDLAGNFNCSRNGDILDCNKSFARILGYSTKQEILSKNLSEFFGSPSERNDYYALLEMGNELHSFECNMRRKDGSLVWVLQSVILLKDNNGSRPIFQGTMIDISQRKKAQDDLSESEDLVRGIILNAPVGILYLDHDGRVICDNPISRVMFNDDDLADFSLLGKVMQGFPGFAKFNSNNLIDRVISGEIVTEELNYIHSKNGVRNVIEIHGAPRYDSQNKVIGAVLMILDITNYRVLEDQFRQSQKMEAIGTLASGIAHDFNNLLTALSGQTDLVKMEVENSEPIAKYFDDVQKFTDRAAALSGQLLAFSRKQKLDPKVVNPASIIGDMKDLLLRIIGEDIELMSNVEADLFPIKVDKGQIEQVVLNLVVNARDAITSGGVISIETSNFFVDEEFARVNPEANYGQHILISIKDNGCGMDEQTMTRIFEPFFTTKEVGKGTGLGLSTVYGIVKQSDGFILVFSELGKETTFQIYLPRAESDFIATEITKNDRFTFTGTESVLVVEDEQSILDLVSSYMQSQGYSVRKAMSGSEALEVCESMSTPFDIVITDVVMPRMNGLELFDIINQKWPETKVLFISGYNKDYPTYQGKIKYKYPYLAKPFQFATLAKMVREILDVSISDKLSSSNNGN